MSKTFNISLLPGDGTGPEVVDEAVKVLSKTSSYYDTQFNFSQNDLGGDRYLKTGDLVTDNDIKQFQDSDATLIDYRVESITKGSDATAEIVTIINDGHLMKQGRAVSTDVVQGSVESFLNALNK